MTVVNCQRRANIAFTLAIVVAATVAACNSGPSKEELEAAKNTYTCQFSGERLVIRFEIGEARMLMSDGGRVTLYQIPSGSGIRYSNGLLELRGKGMDLQLIRDGVVTVLAGCEQYAAPK